MRSDLLHEFDCIYIINLASRTDRRRETEKELLRIGLGASDPAVTFFSAVRPESADTFPSVGARGCFLSHLEVLRDAVRQGRRSVLICEDDLMFAADVASRIGPLCQRLRTEQWSVFYGGYAAQTAPVADSTPLVEVAPKRNILCAHCVGFRGEAIEEVADYLAEMLDRPAGSPEGGPMHVDGAYSWYRACHPHRRTLAAVPPIAYQRSSRSDINPNLKWYDRAAILHRVINPLRAAKRRLAPRR